MSEAKVTTGRQVSLTSDRSMPQVRFPHCRMNPRKSPSANSLNNAQSTANTSGTQAKSIPHSSSRNSINFDTCNSPDFNSVALEKELTDITDSDNQVTI